MAKAKSKKITLEEALVPVEEQPYKVPENWCWTKLGVVSKFERGITFPASAKESEQTEENIPCLRTANIQENLELGDLIYVNRSYMKHNDNKLVMKDDIIMSSANSRELVGKVSYVHNVLFPMTFGGFVLGIRAKEINAKYLFYHLRYEFLCGKFLGESTQTTNIANINTTTLGNHFFPLPPLVEQKRIVEQIESLFTKLDEAKEKALSVVESFESRKKAILNNAFNGLYSTDWREKHHCTLDDWKDRKINEICIPRAGFAFNSKKFTESGIQIIRMGNLYAGKLNLSRSPVFYDISDVDDNIIKRSMVHDGDILLTLTGTKYKRDYGYAVCIEGEHELLVNQRILCLSPTEKIDKEYLLYYLRSEIFSDIFFSNETGGVNQGNVSSKFVENIEIKLPSIEEQKEISKILKNILTKEEQAKELAEFVIEQIELMKKSILAKAFRGELGTNIATEESAIELLKNIL